MQTIRQYIYQIGAYTRAWGRRDYRIALDSMVETGYKYVGISTHDQGRVIDLNTSSEEAAAVGQEITSRGLEVLSLSAGNFDASASIDTGITQLKRLVGLSVKCGSPSVQINDPAKPELEEVFYKIIAECCDYSAEKGVSITVKPHGSAGAHIRKYVDQVGHRNFSLLYDPGNIYFYSHGDLNPVEDAIHLDGVVTGMSVKDFQLPRDVWVTPGTGMVDFPELIKRLRKGGFTHGPLLVECLSQGELHYVNAEAKKAREFLDEITGSI